MPMILSIVSLFVLGQLSLLRDLVSTIYRYEVSSVISVDPNHEYDVIHDLLLLFVVVLYWL
jgi:hypothetical protein